MKWTVVWLPPAEAELADAWTQAVDRQAITDAANAIDHVLAARPETEGAEFYGDRLLVLGPLHVVYRLLPDDCQVQVLHVWTV
jgi:hypothetical protein